MRLGNVTVGETVKVEEGRAFTISVPDGSAVLVHVDFGDRGEVVDGYGGAVSVRGVVVDRDEENDDAKLCDL